MFKDNVMLVKPDVSTIGRAGAKLSFYKAEQRTTVEALCMITSSKLSRMKSSDNKFFLLFYVKTKLTINILSWITFMTNSTMLTA